MVPHILRCLPPATKYRVFVDVFGGAANVILAVPSRPGLFKVYNDKDKELVNFFRVLKDPELRERLLEKLVFTPYSRSLFEDTCLSLLPDNPVDRAWRVYVLNVQSFAGASHQNATPGRWGYDLSRKNMKKWLNGQERLVRFAEALRDVALECLDFAECIRRYDSPETVIYADPPYYPDARVDNTVYSSYELTRERHKELAGLLNSVQGMVILSGYRCPEYDEWYAGWERREYDLACTVSHIGGTRDTKGQSRPRRTECLWLSPKLVEKLRVPVQLTLF
jgi:DNA adenine methylase